MASIGNDANGYRRILFVAKDGKRKTVRLGKVDKQTAQSYKGRIESLNAAAICGKEPNEETARWLADQPETMLDKLAKVGLIPGRKPKATALTLGEFLDNYINGRSDVGEGTTTNYGQVKRNLLDYFKADKSLASITLGDADKFRQWLAGNEGLAVNTVRRRMGRAKQFFRAAVREELIAVNPFGDQKDCHVRGNRERDHFVSAADAERVLAACLTWQQRVVFALARYGGLRTPSEHLVIRLADIDWKANRFTVNSPKTGKRVVPIFPELRPYLREAYDAAKAAGQDCLLPNCYRHNSAANCNWRTNMTKAIKRAGLKPWPKLFQNLRANRATEVANQYGVAAEAAWIGHDPETAKEHYLRVTADDWHRAAGGTQSGTERHTKQAQQPTVTQSNVMQAVETNSGCDNELVELAAKNSREWLSSKMTPTGLEPVLPP